MERDCLLNCHPYSVLYRLDTSGVIYARNAQHPSTMKKLILFTFLSLQVCAFAQQKKKADRFDTKIREAEGDLNGDGLADKVILSMDTIAADVPLRLQIFFAQANRTLKLVTSTTQLIEPQYPNGGKYSGRQIPNFEIEKGKLIIISDTGHGQSLHTFKYQNGNFELVHFFKVYWDGKNTTTETDFNLLTGMKTLKSKSLGSEKINNQTKSKVLIRPLPKIQDLVAFENKPYY